MLFKNLKEIIKEIISFLFNLIISFAKIIIIGILFIGAISSLLLLIKLFPETAVLITKPFYLTLEIILKIIRVLLYVLLTWVFIYWVFCWYDLIQIMIKKSNIKRENNREKFLNELAKKLNKKGRKR